MLLACIPNVGGAFPWLPETDLEGALQLLQRAHAAVTEAMAARSWPVSCSVGAVTFDAPPDSVDAIVAAADRLMYRVKESGKSAVRVEPFSAEQFFLLRKQ